MTTLADLRREYASRALDEADADPDPLRQFTRWFDEAMASQLLDVNAMTLATASPAGEPSARIVLLKDADEHGFVFYTNYDSAKGRDLAANPRACLLLFWAELERQVRITGSITRTSPEQSDEYFHARPIESQIGAVVSHQSHPIGSRSELESRYAEFTEAHQGAAIARPAQWGGYRVTPDAIEFWQGRTSRLHDRLLYVKHADGSWARSRLQP
jgi:pyridoxamine 5'-phosphate oxidase